MKRYNPGIFFDHGDHGIFVMPKMEGVVGGEYVKYSEIESIKRILAGPGLAREKIEAITEVVK